MKENGINQYLTFKVSEEEYALSVHQIREVLEFQNVSKIPRMPGFMRGIINLRGSVVPVIDLKMKFGLGATEKTVDTSIIVTELAMDDEIIVMGLLTDSVNEVIDIDSDGIEPAPQIGTQIDSSFIKGMGRKEENFIIILDIDRVMTAGEISDLADAQNVPQKSEV